jgi:UDP-N-acetylglucosamine 1-carboxyvinyltransferase
METVNGRIGALIAQVRQERNLSQAEFARRLGTSQSAINRMENGNQNLSMETLGRISDVLNKQLVSLNVGSVNLRIDGGHELKGEITLKTSKNAAVGLLCASLLNHGVTRFERVPKIEEVFRIIETLESIGVSVKWYDGNNLEIRRPEQLDMTNINAESARKTRTVLMFMGPLIHEFSEFKIPYAGGCKLGERIVEPHIFALEQFGVSVSAKKGFYNISVDKHPAGRIVMYETSDTATENVLFAAARTPEQTNIEFASANYAVQDVCFYLQLLGVQIENVGNTKLRVRGIPYIKKHVTYALAEDPVEAMLFTAAAICTNSSITIRRVPIEFMELELLKLKKMGLRFETGERYKAKNEQTDLVDLVIHKHDGKLKALPHKLHPNVFPAGINADNLPYFVPICTVVRGTSLIHDWMYENRAIYYTELTKIGAQIDLADPYRLYIHGPSQFTAADLTCPPALRPASLLLVGMLAAKGRSMLRDIYTINRGYEDLAERLNSLGAQITVLNEP